jgi:membrane associated rhomboid family serine protease
MNINSFSNFNSNNNDNQPSFQDRVKAWWAEVPLFTRFVIVSTLALYLISWIITIDKHLQNIPNYTFYSIQVWRLFTSVLMTASIINILFAFISWIPDAMKLEKTSGTVRYGLNFFLNSTIIQIIYTVAIVFLASIFSYRLLSFPSSGLWPLIMAEITMLCLANPDNQVMMFFIPYPFKALYYPWALFGFFTLMNMTIQLDILAGIGYGYLFFFYLRNYIQFSDNFVRKCEESFIFRNLSNFSGFVPLQSSNFNNNNSQNAGSTYKIEPADRTPVTTPFKGKGTIVGKFCFNL